MSNPASLFILLRGLFLASQSAESRCHSSSWAFDRDPTRLFKRRSPRNAAGTTLSVSAEVKTPGSDPNSTFLQKNANFCLPFFTIATLLLPTYSKTEMRAKKINKFMKCQANVTIQGWCNTKKSGIILLSFFPYNQRLQRCFESFVEVDGVHFDLDLNVALPTKIQHVTEFTRWNLAAKLLLPN